MLEHREHRDDIEGTRREWRVEKLRAQDVEAQRIAGIGHDIAVHIAAQGLPAVLRSRGFRHKEPRRAPDIEEMGSARGLDPGARQPAQRLARLTATDRRVRDIIRISQRQQCLTRLDLLGTAIHGQITPLAADEVIATHRKHRGERAPTTRTAHPALLWQSAGRGIACWPCIYAFSCSLSSPRALGRKPWNRLVVRRPWRDDPPFMRPTA